MKKHNILTKSLAAIVAVTLVGQAAHAATYNADDLILGFRATGGTGATKNVVVNIGQASAFRDASGSFAVSTGAIASDLTTAFTTWNAHRADGSNGGLGSDVVWSVTGTSGSFAAVGADPAKTLYATRKQPSLGVQSLAWSRGSDTAQGTTTNLMKAFGIQYATYTLTGNGSAIQNTGDVNSYSSYQPGGTVTNSGPTPGTSFKAYNPSAETSAALGTADLYRMEVGSGPGTYLGTFALDDQGNLNFLKGTATPTPTLTAPASSSSNGASVALNYSLPVSAQAGSLTVDFNDGTPHVLTLASAASTPGAHTFSVNPQNPTASVNVVSGAAIPDGTYTVTVSYQDLVGHTAATAVSTSVVVDSHAPVIDDTAVATTGYDSTTGIPDLTSALVVTDFSSITTVQSPAPGSILGAGTKTITFTSTDALGNVAVETTDITVALGTPVNTSLVASSPVIGAGDTVPGAGVTLGIASNAKFTFVGIPAINDAGHIAYQAKWTAAAVGLTPKTTGWGIFGGNPIALIAKVGDSAPGVAAATIKGFKDPVLNSAGKVAFGATIKDGGATSTSDSVILTNAITGSLQLVAREGSTVSSEADSAKVLSFLNYSVQGAEVLYTAKLKEGTPAVTATNDIGAFAVDADGTHHVIREGDSLSGSTVKTFKLLGAAGLTSAQTRGHAVGTSTFQALLVDKSAVLADSEVATLPAANTLSVIKKTGQTTGGAVLPAATFKALAGPVAVDGAQEATLATLTSGVGGVLGTDDVGIFLGTGSAFEPVVREGDSAGVGLTFSAFNDPLLADGAVAFPAKVKVTATGVATLALWWKPSAGPLSQIAKLTEQPPSTTAGGLYKAFKSLVIPSGGSPLFTATLAKDVGGVVAETDFALFAVNSAGTLSKIIREGDVIGGKTVSTVTVLSTVGGSAGVTHSFNSNGGVVSLVKFTDKTSAIISSIIP